MKSSYTALNTHHPQMTKPVSIIPQSAIFGTSSVVFTYLLTNPGVRKPFQAGLTPITGIAMIKVRLLRSAEADLHRLLLRGIPLLIPRRCPTSAKSPFSMMEKGLSCRVSVHIFLREVPERHDQRTNCPTE